MLVAAEWGTGQVLWSILWFFLFFMWIWLVITVFADIISDHNMSGWGKALWSIGIIVLPFLGVFLYLIVNGNSMNERAAEAYKAQDEATQEYIRQAAGGGDVGGQLSQLADLHNSGKLSDDEYEKAKAKVVNG